MNTDSKDKISSGDGSRLATAEQRLRQLGIKLPEPPEPFGIYAEAVQTGNLLFLTGMLPTVGREAKFTGHLGAELDVEASRLVARFDVQLRTEVPGEFRFASYCGKHSGEKEQVARLHRFRVEAEGFRRLWKLDTKLS